MECRRCAACDRAFRPRAQIPHQRYCALAACQRERRRRWQLSKLHSDADYRANQRQAQRAWADGHGEFCKTRRTSAAVASPLLNTVAIGVIGMARPIVTATWFHQPAASKAQLQTVQIEFQALAVHGRDG